LTSSQQPTSNDEVPDRDADADVIAVGREPRGPLRPGGLFWLFVLAETVALVVAVAVAVHYRTEVHPGAPIAVSASTPRAAASLTAPPSPPSLPEVSTVVLALPADGTVTGTVVITTAALPGAARGQFTVSAVITGGAPGTFYDLIGNDCSTADPLPDDVWATGLAGPNGTADLVGYAWSGAVADRYWLVLDPSPVSPPPGLSGPFAEGRAAPFPAGQAPCAPSP
jgi:hypothetical protein